MKSEQNSNTNFKGVFHFQQIRNGKIIDEWDADNVVVIEGRTHLLDVGLHGSAQIGSWYIGIYSGSVSPDESYTGASVSSTVTEISDSYTPASRPAWDESSAVSGDISNAASPAAFTFSGAKTVNGAFLISQSIRGGGSDAGSTLMACANFTTARSVADADVLNVTYSLNTTST